jgi:integrase
MARKVAFTPMNDRASRKRLPRRQRDEPHWLELSKGLHLGYRKLERDGTWIARARLDGAYQENRLGRADDLADADGKAVLTFNQAQDAARVWHQSLTNPDAPKPAGAMTVAAACESYIRYLTASGSRDIGRVKTIIMPALGHRRIADLSRTEIDEWKFGLVTADDEDDDAERRSQDTANKVLALLKAALNRAYSDEKNGIASDRAWSTVKPFRNVARRREVFLDKAERTRLINTCQGSFRGLVIAGLVTGCRYGELAGMRVRDLRAQDRTLKVVDGKTGARDVILTIAAVEFFQGLAAGRKPDDWLLTRDDGSPWRYNNQVAPMSRAVKRAGLPEGTCFYSLRHAYASEALMAGMNMQLLAENMGTSVKMIERNYGKFTKTARQALIEASAIQVDIPRSNVIALT